MSSRIFLLCLLVSAAQAAEVPPVVAPARRTESLEAAQKLLGQKDASFPAEGVNPFYSTAFAEATNAAPTPNQTIPTPGQTEPVRTSGPRTEREMLIAMATSLKASGYIEIGGQPSLAFGQKRVKAGGVLTINFEGNDYTVEVVSLNRTHFTLRLNREEFTRPIK